jgi:hypothetical protein
MTDSEERSLLEEYRVNVELWKHDDTLRQTRTGNFLQVNSVLLATFCALISIQPGFVNVAISSILLPTFGILISLCWHSVMTRNSDYIRLRRFQLRSIEACFPRMSTFKNTYNALYKHEPVSFECTDELFTVSKSGRRGSTVTESMLPIGMLAFWLLVFVVSVISTGATLIFPLLRR